MGYRSITAILVSSLWIVGCANTKRSVITIHPQPIKLPSDPVNYVSRLNDKSSPDEVVKAWVSTATAYRNWNRIVRKQIESINPA